MAIFTCQLSKESFDESVENFQCPLEYILGKARMGEIALECLQDQEKSIRTSLPNAPFHELPILERVFEKSPQVESCQIQKSSIPRIVDKYTLFLCKDNRLEVESGPCEKKVTGLSVPHAQEMCHCLKLLGWWYSCHLHAYFHPFKEYYSHYLK